MIKIRNIVALIMVFCLIPNLSYAKSCQDNQFNFERIVRPFGESLKRLRDAVLQSRLTPKMTNSAQSGPWSEKVLQSFFGMGAYLQVFPPWYASQRPTLKEFYFDTVQSAKVSATEGWRLYRILQQFASNRPIDRTFMYEKGIARKILRSLQQNGYGLVEAMGFLPVHISVFQTPVRRILEKQFREPGYKPSASELATLKKYNMYEIYMERAQFLKRHPLYHRVKYGSHKLMKSLLFISIVAVLNQFLILAEEDAMITDEEFVGAPKYSPDLSQVQLLVDMVPFPHLAIRIGNEVYSYGHTHLSKMSDSEYVMQRKLRKIDYDLGVEKEEARDAEKDQGSVRRMSFNGLHGLIGKLGLDKLPLSVQVVTLNLGVNEVRRVRGELESNLGKRYVNETGVNDCATMVMRVLNLENQLIDASPSQVAMWFSMQKTMGSDVVDSVRTVMVEDTDNRVRHLYRNTTINFLESQYFVRFFAINQAHRIYIDQKYPEDSDLQFYSAKMKRVIASYEEKAKKVLETDVYLTKYRLKKKRVLARGNKDLILDLKNDISQYVQSRRQKAKEAMNLESGDLMHSILAHHELSLLDSYEKELLDGLD